MFRHEAHHRGSEGAAVFRHEALTVVFIIVLLGIAVGVAMRAW